MDFSRIHFVGICGSGMSSVANLMRLKGKMVSGSDRSLCGHHENNVTSDVDLVVHTNAVSLDNPELIKAQELGIPILTYPELLGLISKNTVTIAVSGTHGKTTTTAMIASVLSDTEFDPTVVVGANIVGLDTNSMLGTGKYLLTEADEYRKSFLNLHPFILVITNIDEDHLDFYKDLKDIQKTFLELARRVPKEGFVICDTLDPHVVPVIKNLSCNIVDYKLVDDFEIQIPGKHNRDNASAALAVSTALGVDESFAREKLGNFKGVSRRFEYKGKTAKGALVYDDYAHNPQKVASALAGAKEAFPNKKIIAVFQPHLYSRTKSLFHGFSQAFKNADSLLLAPIYAAREPFDPSISSEMLAEAVNTEGVASRSFASLDALGEVLVKEFGDDSVIVLIGAGDITTLSRIALS